MFFQVAMHVHELQRKCSGPIATATYTHLPMSCTYTYLPTNLPTFLPARSIKCSFPAYFAPVSLLTQGMRMRMIECDRLECAFMSCTPTARCEFPCGVRQCSGSEERVQGVSKTTIGERATHSAAYVQTHSAAVRAPCTTQPAAVPFPS